jgi:hypothetical protein
MKKIFFLLFFPLWGLESLFAQATVTPVSVNYDRQEVTFRVVWNNATAANNRVWVWVDFCSAPGASPATFVKANIGGATVTSGSIAEKNTRGFYINVTPATITVKLENAIGKFNWCAYGSDYPPNIGDYSNGTYTLRGTPPFTLKDASGAIQIVTGTTIAKSSLTIIPITMTDETGCSGNFCKYVGTDLFMNETYKCDLRASDTKNWEAYIKDVRDNQIYRIVQMPTNTWWMAQDLMWDGRPNPSATSGYTVRGIARSCGSHLGCGRTYNSTATGAGTYSGSASSRRSNNVCSDGWVLPSANELCSYAASTASPQPYLATNELSGPDTYGLSLYICGSAGWNCGTCHTAYVGGSGSAWRHYRCQPEYGCNDILEESGARTVRCVRDL